MGDSLFDFDKTDNNDKPEDEEVVVSKAELDKLVADQEANQKALREALAKQNELLETIKQKERVDSQKNLDPNTDREDEESLEAIIDKFSRDPKGFVKAVAQGEIGAAEANRLAPILAPMVETNHNFTIKEQRAEFDERYGVGSFDEHVLPTLTRITEGWREAGQTQNLGNPAIIEAHVNRIKGEKYDELKELEVKQDKAREAAEEEAAIAIINRMPGAMPPRMRNTGKTELDDEGKLFLSELSAAGAEAVDTKEFQALRATGNSIDDYLAVQNELKESK